MKHVQHPRPLARCLRAQTAEQPVQSIAVGELGAIRVIPFDYRCQQLIQVSGYLVPGLTALVTRKSDEKTLRRDHVDLVDGFQDQIQYTFLLEQVLAISQGSEFVLFLLVFYAQKRTMVMLFVAREKFSLTHVVFGLSKVIDQVFQTHHHLVQIHILEEHGRSSIHLQRL